MSTHKPYTNSFTELIGFDSANPVDDYIAALPVDRSEALSRVVALVRESVPDLTQGITYAMPALFHRGKALVALMSNKDHLSYYPCSGRAIDAVAADLQGFSLSTGTVRFTPSQPIPDDVVRRLATVRAGEIDEALARKPSPHKRSST